MGLFSRFADRVADRIIEKAPSLPAGSSTMTEAQARATAEAAGAQVDVAAYVPLPRFDPIVPFGPGQPSPSVPIDPLEERARPRPRRYEYPVSWNLPGSGTPLVPFSILRDVADRVDIIRRCIEVRKAQLTSLSWDIALSPDAVSQVMAEQNIQSPGRASQIARRKLAQPIEKARDFFRYPDRPNGLGFTDWLSNLLEELFTIDAVSIYPLLTLGGDVTAFQIIDGATIKPLLDHLGNTPAPPQPAYQQILYGFPRGEYVASTDVDQEFGTDRLVYRPRHRRSWTPYGLSQVEQALSVADLYLKRLEWVRSEFAVGSTPSMFIKTDIAVAPTAGPGVMTPDQLNAYEDILNASLSGMTENRKRLHLLGRGMDPSRIDEFAEKFKPDFDEYLIKLVCACFDIMPTEIGFSPRGGLGGKGHSEGEESTTYRKAIRPTVVWLQNLFNDLMWTYLGVPRELVFQFQGYEIEDQHEVEQTIDIVTRGGRGTINEDRASKGLPLFDFVEADEAFVVTGAGIQFLNGAMALQTQAAPTNARPIDSTPAAPVAPQPSAAPGAAPRPATGPKVPAVAAEAAKFARYARKRVESAKVWRDFEFHDVDDVTGALLNQFGAQGQLDSITKVTAAFLVEGRTNGMSESVSARDPGPFLGKARARVSPGPRRAALVKKHRPHVKSQLLAAFPTVNDLQAYWAADLATGKGIDPDLRARALALVNAHTNPLDGLADTFDPIYPDGYQAGEDLAAEYLDDDPDQVDVGDRYADRSTPAALLLAAGFAATLAAQLASRQNPDLSGAYDDVDALVDARLDFEVGVSMTSGQIDGYERRDATVRLAFVADGGACPLCTDADGNAPTDSRPPLHDGCGCTIEPES